MTLASPLAITPSTNAFWGEKSLPAHSTFNLHKDTSTSNRNSNQRIVTLYASLAPYWLSKVFSASIKGKRLYPIRHKVEN